MPIDPNGQRVIEFGRMLLNATREAAYVDTVVAMFTSGAWRHYEVGTGVHRWRAREFDYFLISEDAVYRDVQKALGWQTVKAAKIAEAMDLAAAPRDRRPLEQASREWTGSVGPTLVELAQKNGWTAIGTSRLKQAPVPERARARVLHGMSKDEHARQVRRKAISAERRQVLDQLVTTLMAKVEEAEELRYVVDQMRRHLAGRGRPDGSPRHTRWEQDIAAVNGDRAKLATRWGVSRKTTQKRLERLSDK